VGDPANRRAMRAAVNRWGLRVMCLACTHECRHKPEQHGRLRRRLCPQCGLYGLRSRSWVIRNPEAARKLRTEHRQLEAVFR